MSNELELAERTAADAGRALVAVIDFSISILRELTSAVTKATGMRQSRADPVKYSIHEAASIHKYTGNESNGEVRLPRYVFVHYNLPPERQREVEGRLLPFILIPLVNSEGRPPSIVTGVLQNVTAQRMNEDGILQNFMLWLSERLNEIQKTGAATTFGWEIEKELTGRTDAIRLSSRVCFQVTSLFDIDSSSFPARASAAAQWFIGRMDEAANRSGGGKSRPAKSAGANKKPASEAKRPTTSSKGSSTKASGKTTTQKKDERQPIFSKSDKPKK